MSEELDLLKKLNSGAVSEEELLDIFNRYKDNYRIRLNLAMHPKFPQKYSMNIVSRLFAADLVRVVKNKRANPYIRKKAELEFTLRYEKIPLGEKKTYLKIAPYSILRNLIEETDKKLLEVILNNATCSEELVIMIINRKRPRHTFYEALMATEWYKRRAVAEAIAFDAEAPIRILVEIIAYLSKGTLKRLYENRETHNIVKRHIINTFKDKQSKKKVEKSKKSD